MKPVFYERRIMSNLIGPFARKALASIAIATTAMLLSDGVKGGWKKMRNRTPESPIAES